MNINTYPWEDFGLSFTAPSDPSQPWEICTCWRRDDFMQVLLAVRPSLQNLQALLTLANVLYDHDQWTNHSQGSHWKAKGNLKIPITIF